MAANKASIRVLEKVLDLLLQQTIFVSLHERRKAPQLLRRAYDLEIDNLVDLTYILGGDEKMTFYLFAKVLQYRSRTLLEALWLRRLFTGSGYCSRKTACPRNRHTKWRLLAQGTRTN